jgi:hypothetical protein
MYGLCRGIYYTSVIAMIPVGAFLTRGFWAGKPLNEKELIGKYEYLNEVQTRQKKALQELLDA